MIKINLLKQNSKMKSHGKKSSSSIDENKHIDAEDVRKEAIRRFLMILIFPICLILYEALSVPDQQSSLLIEEKKLKDINDFIAKNNQIAESIKKMQNRENIISLKIAEIEKKASEKNSRVQMLDVLQQLIPDRVWLTKLTENDANVTLSGMAMNESELNVFLEALSQSLIFREVSMLNSNQTVLDGNSLKKFEISFKLGGKNE